MVTFRPHHILWLQSLVGSQAVRLWPWPDGHAVRICYSELKQRHFIHTATTRSSHRGKLWGTLEYPVPCLFGLGSFSAKQEQYVTILLRTAFGGFFLYLKTLYQFQEYWVRKYSERFRRNVEGTTWRYCSCREPVVTRGDLAVANVRNTAVLITGC
jgi:hypothetical protein